MAPCVRNPRAAPIGPLESSPQIGPPSLDGLRRRFTGSSLLPSRDFEDRGSSAPKVSFHGAPLTAQRANASQADAIDLASVITLANELRAAMVEKGLIKGGA